MKNNINLKQFSDFIERNTDNYTLGECSLLGEAIVTYAEYAVRKKYEGNDEEAGLYMAAALNYAFLYSFDRAGRFYSYELKRSSMSNEDCIIHYALKLAHAEYVNKPLEETRKYMDLLLDKVSDYILEKEDEEDSEEQ